MKKMKTLNAVIQNSALPRHQDKYLGSPSLLPPPRCMVGPGQGRLLPLFTGIGTEPGAGSAPGTLAETSERSVQTVNLTPAWHTGALWHALRKRAETWRIRH